MYQKHLRFAFAAVAALLLSSTTITYAQETVAYDSPVWPGNQVYLGNLGLDFTVNQPIVVNALGAFDASTPNGFFGAINVGIWSNPGGALVVGPATLGPGFGDFNLNGDQFRTLLTPVVLLPGNYSVVALYNGVDANGNATIGGITLSTENGDSGAVSFTGNGRYDSNGALDFPTSCVGCSAVTNEFVAGTFEYEVCEAPTLTKSFGAPNGSILAGQTSTLTFVLTSPNCPLTNLSFSDTLPSAMVVSTPNGLTGSCGGGTITAVPASHSISLSGAEVDGFPASSASCTFTVNVTSATGGTMSNATTLVTDDQGLTGTAATASVYVYNWNYWWFFAAP